MLPDRLHRILKDLNSFEWVNSLLKEGDLYIVGGSVRDAYRSKEIKDIDLIVTKITMSRIKDILISFGRVDQVGESFAVIKFRPFDHNGEDFDIAIPRTDIKTGTGHKDFLVNVDNVSILEDLKRRDFTINSIAINVKTGELLDPFHGMEDIISKVLRATDELAFIEDPLRILRGIQFAARFGFEIDPDTLKLMKDNSHLIKEITGERIMDEFMKILRKKGDTQKALNLIYITDVDKALFDKKMLYYDIGLENLDIVSFFYILGILADVDSADFVKRRLKGEFRLEKDLRNMDRMFINIDKNLEDTDLKFVLSKLFSDSPSLMESTILPKEIEEIIRDMRAEKIPYSLKSVQVTGDDVITISQGRVKGKEIGELLDRILRDAFKNKFNWKDRRDSMEYLAGLIYGTN